jgi:hypothetical protein
MLAMRLFFWDDADWVVAPALGGFWCALTGSSAYTGGGTIEELG